MSSSFQYNKAKINPAIPILNPKTLRNENSLFCFGNKYFYPVVYHIFNSLILIACQFATLARVMIEIVVY
jgi:hypothetical protein